MKGIRVRRGNLKGVVEAGVFAEAFGGGYKNITVDRSTFIYPLVEKRLYGRFSIRRRYSPVENAARIQPHVDDRGLFGA